MKDKSGIYKIVNMQTGDFYIGSSICIIKRWYRHRTFLLRNVHPNKYLQNAWNKYGDKNFEFQVIENCDREVLIKREQEHVSTLMPTYNLAKVVGNSFGKKHSEETKEKLSKIFKGREPSNKGVKRSPETIERLKEAWVRKKERGYKISDEGRANLSKSLKGKPKSEAYKKSRTGIKMSPESIRKTALANTGKKRSEETKKRYSENMKGKYVGEKNPMYGMSGEKSPNFGKECKESTRKLISERAKERWALKKQSA